MLLECIMVPLRYFREYVAIQKLFITHFVFHENLLGSIPWYWSHPKLIIHIRCHNMWTWPHHKCYLVPASSCDLWLSGWGFHLSITVLVLSSPAWCSMCFLWSSPSVITFIRLGTSPRYDSNASTASGLTSCCQISLRPTFSNRQSCKFLPLLWLHIVIRLVIWLRIVCCMDFKLVQNRIDNCVDWARICIISPCWWWTSDFTQENISSLRWMLYHSTRFADKTKCFRKLSTCFAAIVALSATNFTDGKWAFRSAVFK